MIVSDRLGIANIALARLDAQSGFLPKQPHSTFADKYVACSMLAIIGVAVQTAVVRRAVLVRPFLYFFSSLCIYNFPVYMYPTAFIPCFFYHQIRLEYSPELVRVVCRCSVHALFVCLSACLDASALWHRSDKLSTASRC